MWSLPCATTINSLHSANNSHLIHASHDEFNSRTHFHRDTAARAQLSNIHNSTNNCTQTGTGTTQLAKVSHAFAHARPYEMRPGVSRVAGGERWRTMARLAEVIELDDDDGARKNRAQRSCGGWPTSAAAAAMAKIFRMCDV